MEKGNSSLSFCPVVSAGEFVEFQRFLKSCGLPEEDIRLPGNLFALYRDHAGQTIGTGGLEFYGTTALMRSVAVALQFREQGLGEAIARDLIARARDRSMQAIYLLTETAQPFFEKLGFRTVSRDEAPLEIKGTSQFSAVCPVTAVVMGLEVWRG